MALIEVTDVRCEGLPQSIADDEKVEGYILDATELIETITGNIFEKRTGTFVFDGTNSHLLQLPIPLVSVTSLKINGIDAAIDPLWYKAFTGRQKPNDDRHNPKIELRTMVSGSASTLFSGLKRVFQKGLDQTIEGDWGYLEADDSTPRIVKQVAIGIVMTMADPMFDRYSGGRGATVGPMVSEKTDGHELKWGATKRDIGDYVLPQVLEDRLRKYRRPTVMGVPEVRWNDVGWVRIK